MVMSAIRSFGRFTSDVMIRCFFVSNICEKSRFHLFFFFAVASLDLNVGDTKFTFFHLFCSNIYAAEDCVVKGRPKIMKNPRDKIEIFFAREISNR